MAAAQLRHSTFSALNLEVGGGARKNSTMQPLSRQTIAELQSEWAASKQKAERLKASVASAETPTNSDSSKLIKPCTAASSIEVLRCRQLSRDVNSLLNKVCPENVSTIVERVASTEI